MLIGGLQKFSLLDYPGYISAIVFTQGCNFRCQFCYNPMLVWPTKAGEVKYISSGDVKEEDRFLKENDLLRFLENRFGKLEAVVITGGEPTLHADLPKFIEKIKKIGYLVKLDTNGTNPEMLKKLLENNNSKPDYFAMDFKASEAKYNEITGVEVDFKKIKESVKIIKDSKVPHEFRTTVVPGILTEKDIEEIGEIIKGSDKWFLQKFKSDINLINKNLEGVRAFTEKEMEVMRKIGGKYVDVCEVR